MRQQHNSIVAGPAIWNELPPYRRPLPVAPSDTLHCNLITVLFSEGWVKNTLQQQP